MNGQQAHPDDTYVDALVNLFWLAVAAVIFLGLTATS